MSNSKLSFSIAIKLLTDNFKKGTVNVKSYLRSMQMQFMSFTAALGAGTIGLTNFVSRMIETAKETSRVNIALKNVSGTTREYLNHQQYLIGLSKKYGVQINALTSGFAKFKAAADISNMPLSDQYKIFESVSRAAVAFGLSSEDQKGVFLALSQMMSKNKVQAEELRLQMAERLPVAIQAMAKAAGVSVEELDKLMKQGKLYASDVLPRFAEALDSMIPNVDTDNLNASLARLSNTFVDLVKNFDIEGRFKRIVETVSDMLRVLGNNAKAVFIGLKVIIIAGLANAVRNVFGAIGSKYDDFVAAAVKSRDRLKSAQEATARAEAAASEASAAKIRAIEAEKALAVDASENQKRAARNRSAAAEIALTKKTAQLVKAQEREKAAAAQMTAEQTKAAAASGATGMTRAMNIVKFNSARLWATIKAAFSATLWTGAISAVMALVGWLIKAYTETRRIKSIVSDMSDKLAQPTENAQADSIAKYRQIYNDKSNDDVHRMGALKEINSLLGTSYKYDKEDIKLQDEINDKISLRLKLLKAQDEYNQAAEAVNAAKSKIYEIENSDRYKEALAEATEIRRKYRDKNIGENLARLTIKEGGGKELEELRKSLYLAENVLEARANKMAYLSGLDGSDSADFSPLYSSGGKGGKKTELEKQEGKYKEALNALAEKRKQGIITEQQYDNALRDLVEKTYIRAASSEDATVKDSEWLRQLEEKYRSMPRGEEYERQKELAAAIEEYRKSVQARTAEFEQGLISEKQYREALFELIREVRARMAPNLSAGDDFDRVFAGGLDEIYKGLAPHLKLKTRDTSRDYRKSDVEILEDELSVAKSNRDAIRQAAEEYAGLFDKELAAAMGKVKTLEEALKVAEAREAVKALAKEYRAGLYEGTKGVVGNVDNIVSAFERVGEVMSDADASGWEKIMSVWEAMTSMTDAFLQTIELIERLTKVKEMLTKAEEAEAAASTLATETKVANAAATVAADTSETANTVANAGIKVAAKQGEAAADAGASAAKTIPFPASLIAIGAAISAVLAAFAMIPRFEKGGIVGGGSPKGDKILARLNSGEMILNKNQQGTLYGLLNSRSRDSHITGEFKVRGRDLVAAIDNNNKFRQRTR